MNNNIRNLLTRILDEDMSAKSKTSLDEKLKQDIMEVLDDNWHVSYLHSTYVAGWPKDASVKIRWMGEDGIISYANRNSEGKLVSHKTGNVLCQTMWEVLEERFD